MKNAGDQPNWVKGSGSEDPNVVASKGAYRSRERSHAHTVRKESLAYCGVTI